MQVKGLEFQYLLQHYCFRVQESDLMDRLPVEIAHLVLKELHDNRTSDEIPLSPLSNLKALQLSCKFFTHLAASYLFHCVLWVFSDCKNSYMQPSAPHEKTHYLRHSAVAGRTASADNSTLSSLRSSCGMFPTLAET